MIKLIYLILPQKPPKVKSWLLLMLIMGYTVGSAAFAVSPFLLWFALLGADRRFWPKLLCSSLVNAFCFHRSVHPRFSILKLILLISDTQGPGWYVLSKTRRTARETAGIPIWSPSDSCSACAASAQRCPLFSSFNFYPLSTNSKGILHKKFARPSEDL